jgi:Protein of unknown function (DUF4058)
MRPPFPGTDPWLEHPALWPDIHNSLITAIRDELVPKVAPKYFVGLEQRTFLCRPGGTVFIGRPDIGVSRTPGIATAPELIERRSSAGVGVLELDVEVPVKDVVNEWYLEIHETATAKVVTVIEVLSPTNKSRSEGRKQYLKKRNRVLDTRTSLVEIDLLRAGKPMPITTRRPVQTDYRILVSRGAARPRAKLYAFGVRQAIPVVPIPLLRKDPEPMLDLNAVFHALYERARFDLRLDYASPPVPRLEEDDAAWAQKIASSSSSSS